MEISEEDLLYFNQLRDFSLFKSVDNSDYMRNGDFAPSRLQSQFDAVNMITVAKTKSHPENNVGLLSLAE